MPVAKNFIEIGVSGLQQFGGVVDEEWLRKLQGARGRKTLREMADNDAVVGAILFAVEMLARGVAWRVEPHDDSPDAREDAEFVESLMTDMSHTWNDFVAEILSMLVFGFSPHEIVYKRRLGPDQKDPTKRSRYTDGLVGWRKLPLRSQDTLDRWEFDEDGGIKGMWQTPPAGGAPILIPVEKLLLFRTTSRKNNPEGRSVLRNAYVDWYHKTRISSYEAIGVERDLAGLPLIYVPQELLDPNAPADVKTQLAEYKKIVQNVRNDEQAGLILPAVFDDNGNRMVEFTLTGTGSRRMFDTGAIIERHDRRMAMVVLADFILLGHEKVGSLALSSDKTDLFAAAMGAWLDEIAAVLNRHALPRLYAMNAMDQTRMARFAHGDIEKAEVEQFSNSVAALTAAGWLTPGGEKDEAHVREFLDLPAQEASADPASRPKPAPAPEDEDGTEE